MPEWVTAFWQWLINLEMPTGWAALTGALIGATAGYATREFEEHRRRRRERRGLLKMLEIETGYNEDLLNVYQEHPAQIAEQYRPALSTRAWDKTSIRLAQLLKDDKLLADLSEYYEEIRAIVLYVRDPAVTLPKARDKIEQRLPKLKTFSSSVRPRLQRRSWWAWLFGSLATPW